MLCNSVEGNSHFHHESPQARTAQLTSFCSCVWHDQATHQSMNKYEFDDYIFAFSTEMNGKTPADSRYSLGKIEMKTSIPRGLTIFTHQGKVLNDKKTREENNIGAEATIEMSLRLLGGMEK